MHMKYLTRKAILIVVLIVMPYFFIGSSVIDEKHHCDMQTFFIKEVNPNNYTDYEMFAFSLGWRESHNRYDIINKWGYLGKYQFSPITLRWLGYEGTFVNFLESPELQELYFFKLLQSNQKNLKKYIEYFENHKKDSILITESGILAAAHLVGPNNVRKYFDVDYVKRDALGTPITEYLYLFQGYKLNLEEPFNDRITNNSINRNSIQDNRKN